MIDPTRSLHAALPVVLALATTGCLEVEVEPEPPALHCSAQLARQFGTEQTCFEIIDGQMIVEGDISIGPAAAVPGDVALGLIGYAGDERERLWPGGVVPYRIASAFTPAEREVIQAAIAHYNARSARTGITWVARENQADYVVFRRNPNLDFTGYSSIGRQGGAQTIQLNPTRSTYRPGLVIHEMGHTLGLWHTQNREDRDEHVVVHWDNIASSKRSQYSKKSALDFDDIGSYDSTSVMTYGSLANAIDRSRPTLTRLNGSTFPSGPSRDRLSEDDIQGLAYLYRAPRPAALPFFDAFSRADSIVLGPSWRNQFGKTDLVAGAAQARSMSNAAVETVAGIVASDVEVSGILNVNAAPNTSADLVARYQGPGDRNHYFAGLWRANDGTITARVRRVTGDRYVTLGEAEISESLVAARFTLDGSRLRLYVDDRLVVDVTDDNGFTTAGAVGIRAWQRGARVDEFRASSSAVPDRIVVDDRDLSSTRAGAWMTSQGPSPYRNRSLYADDPAARFTFSWTAQATGSYEVFGRWTYHVNRSHQVPYMIAHAQGSTEVIVDQGQRPIAATFVSLGTYRFDAGETYTVTVSARNGQACADAVAIEGR